MMNQRAPYIQSWSETRNQPCSPLPPLSTFSTSTPLVYTKTREFPSKNVRFTKRAEQPQLTNFDSGII